MNRPSELLDCGSQAKQITLLPESGNLAHRSSRNIRMFAEFLPFIDIGNMHLDGGNSSCRYRISNGHTGMSIRSRIDDDSAKLSGRLLNPTHQLSFAVGLPDIDFHPQLFR